jgi:hypothetical protein
MAETLHKRKKRKLFGKPPVEVHMNQAIPVPERKNKNIRILNSLSSVGRKQTKTSIAPINKARSFNRGGWASKNEERSPKKATPCQKNQSAVKRRGKRLLRIGVFCLPKTKSNKSR